MVGARHSPLIRHRIKCRHFSIRSITAAPSSISNWSPQRFPSSSAVPFRQRNVVHCRAAVPAFSRINEQPPQQVHSLYHVAHRVHALAHITLCSSLSRNQAIATFSGKMTDPSLSPHHGSASVSSSFANSPGQASNSALTSPFSRQQLNLAAYSPASSASSVNQNSAFASPHLGRSLPYSASSHTVPGVVSRIPIRPVGPPPSQQLLSIGDGSSNTSSLFQSLVQV